MPGLSFSPTWIGIAAAVLTTSAFAPQAFKVWKTRSTRDVSLAMFLMMVTGNALWLFYGILINDLPLIVANAVTLESEAALIAAQAAFGGTLLRIDLSVMDRLGRMRGWQPSRPVVQWSVER